MPMTLVALLAAMAATYGALQWRRVASFSEGSARVAASVQRFEAEVKLARRVPRVALGDRISNLQSIQAEARALEPGSRCLKRSLASLSGAMSTQIDGFVNFLGSGSSDAALGIERGEQSMEAAKAALAECKPDPVF